MTKLNINRRLIHYSPEPLVGVRSVYQDEAEPQGFLKPHGLWVSCEGEDDWASWCTAEDFNLDRLINPTEITLADDAKILHLSCAADIDRFEAMYVTRARGPHRKGGGEYRPESVAWDRVAKRYQGIIICPYIWERRLGDTMWYYPWDCASGCIWDKDAIASFRPIAVDKEEATLEC